MHLRPLVHAARVVVKPRPVTFSESFAILRHLKRWGEVTKFAKHTSQSHPPESPIQNKGTSFEDATSIVYAVEFASLPQPFVDSTPRSRQDGHSLRFKIDANAFHPDPYDLDPYNVRGLLNRKPHLAPQRFSCKLTMLKEKQDQTPAETGNGAIAFEDKELECDNPYSGPFSVNTRSVFAEILQQTGAPPNLISGLLPKIDESHPKAPDDMTWSDQYTKKHGQPPSKRATRKWLYAKNKRLRAQPRVVKKEHFSLVHLYNKAIKRQQEGRSEP